MRLEIPGVSEGVEIPDEDFARTPPSVIKAFMEVVAKLAARVAELEEKLNANSRNSSLPPSKDPPGTLRSPKQPTGKKRGGQSGHKGAHRAMVDQDQVTETRTFGLPDHCPDCSCHIPQNSRATRRRQVWEVPRIQPHVTEILEEHATCPGCRKKLRAVLPADVPKGDFGPNVVALVGILQGRFGMSHRDCQELLSQLTGIHVGLGTIPRLCKQVSYALKNFHEELHQHMLAGGVLNVDDTAWKEGVNYRVLFSLNTRDAAYFQIDDRKNHATVKKLLGSFAGCLGADRASTYACFPGRIQHCLAHMDRHFLRIWDRGGASRGIGAQGRKEMDRIWAAWGGFKSGEFERSQLKALLKPIKARMGRLLKAGANCGVAKTANTCRRLLKSFRWMWSFAELEGVEPTNNSSEQAIRTPVCWRRTSFFSQSEAGLRFVERILSAVLTCARRGVRIWDFLAEKCAQTIGTTGLARAPA